MASLDPLDAPAPDATGLEPDPVLDTGREEFLTVRATLPLAGSARPRELRLRRYQCARHQSAPRPCRGARTADGCGPCWVSDARILVAEGEGDDAKLHKRAVVIEDEALHERLRFGILPLRPEDLAPRGSRPARVVDWWGAMLVPSERIGHPRLDDPDWVRRPPRPALPPIAPGARGSLPQGYRLEALDEAGELRIAPLLAQRRGFRMVARDPTGTTCAHADVYWTYDGRLMVSDVWVDPEHRRRGLATAIYCAIERLARSHLTPYPDRTDDARAFWDQPDRPFGERQAG